MASRRLSKITESDTSFSDSTLDMILALQITVAWAGEGLCDPPRLNWWRTDLYDELGGGDLFRRLMPKTHLWASLEAIRQAAIRYDQLERLKTADSEQIRTLFYWGFIVDQLLSDRLMNHKLSSADPIEVLNFPIDLKAPFEKPSFEEAIRIPNHPIDFKVVSIGRELSGTIPESYELQAKRLIAGLLPLSDKYPMPFFHLGN